MNLSHWLLRRAALSPQSPALFAGQGCVADYATFARHARGVAGWLVGQGVRPGDRVAIFMKNTPEYLVALFGIWIAGAAAVPINAKLHGREAAHILKDSGAVLVFASAQQADALAQAGDETPVETAPGAGFAQACSNAPLSAVVERDAQDLAWLFYTSGTTGTPKGVMITHGMLMSMALCYEADVDQVRAEDAALYGAPLSHGAGLYALMHVRVGARHVCPASGGFDPDEILDLAETFGSVHMFAAPTMVKRLSAAAKAAGRKGAGLRTVVYAGGPMYNADIIEAVSLFGPVFVQIYGQGECPMGISVLPRAAVADRKSQGWQARLASVGYAQSAVDVLITDQNGQPVAPGTIGEINVRGATVMPGYWQNPDATATTLVGGWLRTGDMGAMDAQGYITLHDRSKDVIITGGSNVYPREVEEVLQQHPGLREVSVVGRAHAEWGEEVIAFVVGQAPQAELDALCLDHIARFKRPKAYVWLSELPKNNYGKVLKTELRQLLSDENPKDRHG